MKRLYAAKVDGARRSLVEKFRSFDLAAQKWP
jgi:hypothetical protein